MTVLIITEKPSAAENFATALGGMRGVFEGTPYEITHCVGHLFELVDPRNQVKDPQLKEAMSAWEVQYLPWDETRLEWKLGIQKGKRDVVKKLQSQMAAADAIVCATDVDPTGEGGKIFSDVVLETGMENKKLERMYFTDEAPKSIQEAFRKRKPIASIAEFDEYRMADFRSKFDYLFGLQSTRLMTLEAGQGTVLRQGRLKSPIVLLVGQQYEAWKNYVKKPFFQNRFRDENGVIYVNPEEPRFDSEAEVPKQYENSSVVVDSRTMKQTSPPRLVDLADLSARLAPQGLKPKEILGIYQRLYLSKIVSYPRTEDKTITHEQFKEMLPLVDTIAAVVGVDPALLTHRKPRPTHVKDVGAHGANRPGTRVPTSLAQLDAEFGRGASRIYEVLAKNFLAMFAENYEYEQQKGHLEKYPAFVGSANVPTSPGWRAVYDDEEVDEDESQQGLGTNAEPFVHEGANTRPQHPTIKWLITQLEKRNVGTGATRTSTISDVSNGQAALLDEDRGRLTLTDAGHIAYLMLPDTRIGSLDMTEQVMEWMKEVAQGSRQCDDVLAIVKEWVAEDKETMATNADAMLEKLSLERAAPRETVEGEYQGKAVRFNRVWAQHRFTDDEVAKLLAGETIEISAMSKKKKPFQCTVKLGEGEYQGKKTFGVQLVEFVGGQDFEKKDKHTGIFRPTKKEVSFNSSWGGHTFTPQELALLLEGEEITFEAQGKKGPFTATGRLEEQEYQGKKFWGFKLDDIPMNWAGHTFSDSERAVLRRGGEVTRNDFVSKAGRTFSASVTMVKGQLTAEFNRK